MDESVASVQKRLRAMQSDPHKANWDPLSVFAREKIAMPKCNNVVVSWRGDSQVATVIILRDIWGGADEEEKEKGEMG